MSTFGTPDERANHKRIAIIGRVLRGSQEHPVCLDYWKLFPVSRPFYKFIWGRAGDLKRYQVLVNHCELGRLNHLIATMAMHMHCSSRVAQIGHQWRYNDECFRHFSQSESRTRSTGRRFHEDSPHSRGR